MKFAPLALATLVAATGMGLAGNAMADRNEAIDRSTLMTALEQATSGGMNSFKEFEIEREDGQLEMDIEGWSDDGWELDLVLDMQSGTVLSESRSSTIAQPWGLDTQQIGTLLDQADNDGITHISEFDLSRSGNIELVGYGSGPQELERNYSYESIVGQ